MKYFKFFICFSIPLIALISCKKDANKTSFYEKIAGVWIPYQIKYSDGRIEQSSLVGLSMFGAYDECIQLNEDQTFLPGTTYPFNTFAPDTLEKGTFTYLDIEKKLIVNGGWLTEYKIVHFDDNDLWLSSFNFEDVIYYYRRQ